MLEEQVFCALDEIVPIADKQTRAQSIKGRMSMRRVHFPAFASWWQDARNQILTFPHGLEDDFVDALSLIGLGLAKQVSTSGAAARRQDTPKHGTLGWVKWADKQRRMDEAMRNNQGW